MAVFPDPEWFESLGKLAEADRERFLRLGYVESRFAIRVLPDGNGDADRSIGLVFDGYRLASAEELTNLERFDPDFVICGRESVWRRMLDEIARTGRPELRHTLSSLVLVGEDLWLESNDQLREDRFYRYNQTLQEFFNLASRAR